ncbi:DMT family transporter [Aliiroseovarius crassostreae]|uniref:DMT family transporter n=1 Tax=Aliiroseovarius crassostreae TaxID=154981 RepID=A0A9Q9H8G5_9RHOB|nr:DMT family transporter [Aliiroseovarius crassostreae]UWP95483.1 DMT family transporter [Aliiroseovarius crassostreae]
MTPAIATVVLSAALLHAMWNALVKSAGDKTVMLGCIALGHVVPGVVIAGLSPLPDLASVPFMIASIVVHWVYFYLLNVAYRLGDLSLIYPISRGAAPVLVALGAQVWVGETLPLFAWGGICAVSAGIMILSRPAFAGALPGRALLAALGIGVVVASYTLIDGVGVRLSGHAVSYIGWLFAAKLVIVFYVFPTRWERVRAMPRSALMLGVSGGLISGMAYGLVLYAKSIAPLGIVSALRETSVIFAALIGVLWFGEGPRGQRLLAAVVVGMGIGAIALTR